MDAELRLQLLRAAVRDQAFLKAAGQDLEAGDFEEQAEQIIAKEATWFWKEFQEPAGPLIRSYVEEKLAALKMGADSRTNLENTTYKLLDKILGPELKPVSVKALEERVRALRKSHFFEQAVEKVIESHERGKLNAAVLVDLVDRANRELADRTLDATDMLDEEEMLRRIRRRQHQEENVKYPISMIGPLDDKIRLIPKGYTGLILAPFSSGKGYALLWLAWAYAMQNLNVWFITLEDSGDEVQDRIDSMLSNLPKSRLSKLPNRLKRMYRRNVRKIHGKIRVTDWTEEECTISRIEKGYEALKAEGFVVDVIIVDYDDEIVCEKEFRGESARRFELDHNYRQQRKAAARLDVIWWTAAQTGRQGEGKKLIIGSDTADAIGKIRKVALALGVGSDLQTPSHKRIYVIRHKFDRSRFSVDIVSDLARSQFYDSDATTDLMAARSEKKHKRKKAAEVED